MRKADRLFQVVNIIRAHQPVTAAALAERLGVSIRTIYRYIDDLSVSGIPIYGEPGVGYSMQEDFELPPLTLTADERDALSVAVSMLSRSTGDAFHSAARSLLSKIDAVIPRKIPSLDDQAIRSLAEPLSSGQMSRWDQLREAIRAEHAVRIDYVSLRGVSSQRDIFPLGLFYWGGKWTLGAWCFLRGAYRDFRVDLINAIESVSTPLPPKHAINLVAYMAHQAGDRVA